MTIRESFSLGVITQTVDVGYTPVGGSQHVIIDRDTVITDTMSLRPGDAVEFRNGAQLLFGPGGQPDWRGTPVDTWADDGLTQNLGRDIRFFGEGNIRFLVGSRVGTIEYVELDVRPKLEPGFFPLHWHLMGDDSRGQEVIGVVVKNSPNRAYVPHASHGISFFDCIAKDIAGEAWWWNSPAFQSQDRSDNTNDLLVSGCLIDGVTNSAGSANARRLSAIKLISGVGNVIEDTVARRVRGSRGSSRDCSGFHWPEIHHKQPLSWGFNNNAAFDLGCHGIFTWQNNGQEHIIRDFRSDGLISHGAYSNHYEYIDCDVPGYIIHAQGWSVTGGHAGDIFVKRNRARGIVTFTDVTVDSLLIDNARNEGVVPITLVFIGTTLTCDKVTYQRVVPGTKVIINGVECVQ